MTEPQQMLLNDLIKELKKQHNEQMNAVLIYPEVYKYLTRKSHKKIKRRLYYDVYYWTKTERVTKYFESVKRVQHLLTGLNKKTLLNRFS